MLDKLKCATASQLKYLAAFLMFLDHIHQMFHAQGAPVWLTMLGRLVFPIFLFLAADSFHYTRNRKAYLWRLLLGSWFMVVTSSLLQWLLPNDQVVLMNNAFATFFVTGVLIVGWDLMKAGFQQSNGKSFAKGLLIFFLPVLAVIPMMVAMTLAAASGTSDVMMRLLSVLVMMIPNIMMVEGGPVLVLLGLVFYILREHRLWQVLALVLVSAFVYFMGGGIQTLMVFAAIPMLMYNGQKGKESKWFFYIFYPGHIYLLYLLSTLFF